MGLQASNTSSERPEPPHVYPVLEIKSTFDLLPSHDTTMWLTYQIPMKCNYRWDSHFDQWDYVGFTGESTMHEIRWYTYSSDLHQDIKLLLTEHQSKVYTWLRSQCPSWFADQFQFNPDRYSIFQMLHKQLPDALAHLILEWLV